MLYETITIRSFERGLRFVRGEFTDVLAPGRTRLWAWQRLWRKVRVQVVDLRANYLVDPQLDVIARSGALADIAEVVDLGDRERAFVTIDGRLDRVLTPGLTVVWTAFGDVRLERITVDEVRLDRSDLSAVLATYSGSQAVEQLLVPTRHVGLVYRDGELVEQLRPGRYGFWKDVARMTLLTLDLRETLLEVVGQELMTKDRVTLRVNATLTYRVADVVRLVAVADWSQSLYREAQLALRGSVGTRDLDGILADKAGFADELAGAVRARAGELGIQLISLGVRDVILPGDMKELLNKVTEARKAAEAAVITRREETAAMRSQANTARLLADNPTLMRMRELEVLERVARDSDLTVVLGEKGLSDQVLKLL